MPTTHVVFQDDGFEIFIDTDGSSHSYCEVAFNAHGTLQKLFLAYSCRDGDPALYLT